MSINRITAAGLTLLGAFALGGVAMAATPAAAAPAQAAQPVVEHHVEHHVVHPARRMHHRHESASSASAMARMHTRVAETRAAQQERWIADGLQRGRLTLADASAMERAQAALLRRQASLTRSGDETVAQALAVQHRQDLQDWSIRTGHPWA